MDVFANLEGHQIICMVMYIFWGWTEQISPLHCVRTMQSKEGVQCVTEGDGKSRIWKRISAGTTSIEILLHRHSCFTHAHVRNVCFSEQN
jgi:hypothetical protein